jgi:CheY-like chemotaxis protein
VITFYLESSGAVVTTVADGQLAYEQAMVSIMHGKLILMDVQMPKLDGCQATIQLRQAGYAHPIVALTADATDREHRRCMAAGCNGFVAKPVDREELSRTTRRFVRHELPRQATAGEALDPIFDARMDAMRENFRREIPSRIAEISIALSAKELARVADLAHRLRGTAGCYGFSVLCDSSDALQSATELPEADETIWQCFRTLSAQAEALVLAGAA